MTLLYRIQTALKKKSNARPKSLVLYIPSAIRDIMDFEHGSKITLDVCVENNEKMLIIRKVD